MLHNTNPKLIYLAAIEMTIPRLSVGLPAEVFRDADEPPWHWMALANKVHKQRLQHHPTKPCIPTLENKVHKKNCSAMHHST